MRVIADKIRKECYKSKAIQDQYFIEEIKDKTELRKSQNEHYQRFKFFKNLNNAIEKSKEK